jgi:hypothetical protein
MGDKVLSEKIFSSKAGELKISCPSKPASPMTRVNSTNVLDEGLRIGGIGRQMNSKVKSVKQGVYRK